MTELSDRLIRNAARGHRKSVAELTSALTPGAFGLAMRMLANAQDAEDVVQEAFLRLWRTLPEWRYGEAKVSTWLYRVVTNLCIDRQRRRRERALPDGFDMADPADGPARTLERDQADARVRSAVDGLPERQRAAISLVHFQGLSGAEAANILETSVEALESLLARARRTLRTTLADARHEESGA